MRAVAADGPKTIGQMLLYEWYFGLNCEFDVGKVGLLAAIGRDARQYPRTAFLIHQAACAIDRIDDDAQGCIIFRNTLRQNDLSLRQAFSD